MNCPGFGHFKGICNAEPQENDWLCHACRGDLNEHKRVAIKFQEKYNATSAERMARGEDK